MIETINLADGCSFSGKDGVDFTFIWIHFVKIDAAALGMDETSPREAGTSSTKWRLDYTARHGGTSRVLLNFAHF